MAIKNKSNPGGSIDSTHDAHVVRGPGRKTLFAAVVLALVGTAVYANSFGVPFVFDSALLIRNDRVAAQIWPWKMAVGFSRPVGFLSFGLNYALGGKDAWGYHAVNLAIHVAAAWLLFDIVRRTFSCRRLRARYAAHAGGLALAAALIWLVHPLQTNAVTYIYQRAESLMAMFYLATLWCFIKALESPKKACWYAASVSCCALGTGCKEVMATAPLLLLWYDRVFAATSWRELFGQRGQYYAAMVCTWGLLVWLMLRKEGYEETGVLIVQGVSPLGYAVSQPGVLLHYLWLAFWPDRLCMDYCWPVATTAREIVLPTLAIGALLAVTAWAVYRRPAWGFLGGSIFLILAPTSSVAPLRDLAFEHRMYLPLAPLAVFVVVSAYELWSLLLRRLSPAQPGGPRWARFAPAIVTVAVASGLGYRTWVRNFDFQTELTLWQATVATRPESTRAWVSLGNTQLSQNHLPEAVRAASAALDLNPVAPQANLVRGAAYARMKRYDLAIADLSKAIQLNPDDADAYLSRGLAFRDQGSLPPAIRDFDAAINFDSANAIAYNARSTVYGALGRYAEAIADSNRALELDPRYATAYLNRGNALQMLNHPSEALGDYNKAIELDPESSDNYVARAKFYASHGDNEAAARDFTKMIELSPNDANGYKYRATCWYGLRQFDRAWADVQACEKRGGHPAPGFIEALRKAAPQPMGKS